MSHYTTLGLPENATEAQVKKAYRKLPSIHHPDRGGDTATFQSIQVAYAAIEKAGFIPPAPRRSTMSPPPPHQRRPGTSGRKPQWDKPQSPGGTWRDRDDIGNIFEEMKAANKAAPNGGASQNWSSTANDKVARVSLREAFSGFNIIIPRPTSNDSVNIPAGIPNGYRNKYRTNQGQYETVTVVIDTGHFKLKDLNDTNNLFSAGLNVGDIEIEVQLDALDLIVGTWLKTEDFLGEKLDVRVPAGHNPLHRLKIAGKGYWGWSSELGEPSKHRQDMYIKVTPVYKPLAAVQREKVVALYKEIQNMGLNL